MVQRGGRVITRMRWGMEIGGGGGCIARPEALSKKIIVIVTRMGWGNGGDIARTYWEWGVGVHGYNGNIK